MTGTDPISAWLATNPITAIAIAVIGFLLWKRQSGQASSGGVLPALLSRMGLPGALLGGLLLAGANGGRLRDGLDDLLKGVLDRFLPKEPPKQQ